MKSFTRWAVSSESSTICSTSDESMINLLTNIVRSDDPIHAGRAGYTRSYQIPDLWILRTAVRALDDS